MCVPINWFNMFSVYMFSDTVLVLFMLISASSMFVFNMFVAIIVMLNILELIMKIVPNYSTIQKPNCRQFPKLCMANLSDAIRPERFVGMHFKRW